MSIYKTIISRRTIRKFKQKDISVDALKRFVNAGRLAPSARNLQPLEYLIVTDNSIKEKIFSTITWAVYLKPGYNPQSGEEPVAYIIVIINDKIAHKAFYQYDVGASVENIILSALEEGVGCCWIASFKKDKLTKILKIPEGYSIDCVLALGYPLENPTSVDIEKEGSIKYWKDPEGRLTVPKRKLEDIMHLDIFKKA
ncbi:MAG: nitroreductase family protein [Actinobacteria bacterium]|nr:nitroreductase family protein [Actinomycetota bacterium]